MKWVAHRSGSMLHLKICVDVRANAGVHALVGDRRVKAFRLTDGTQLNADLVLIDLGVAG